MLREKIFLSECIFKGFGKVRKTKVNCWPKKTIVIANVPISLALEVIMQGKYAKIQNIMVDIVISIICLFIMAQISLSAISKGLEFIDKLESYKHLKDIVNSTPGRVLAACMGFAKALYYEIPNLELSGEEVSDCVISIVQDMAIFGGPNLKRTQVSRKNWLVYGLGEAVAARGQMLSCPSTNLGKLNIDKKRVGSYGLEMALDNIGFSKEKLIYFNITPQTVRTTMRELMLVDRAGRPIELLYNEPNFIKSKIQNEVFGDKVIRTNFGNMISNKLEVTDATRRTKVAVTIGNN